MITLLKNEILTLNFLNGLSVEIRAGKLYYSDNVEQNENINANRNCEVSIFDEEKHWITNEIFVELELKSYDEDRLSVGYVDTDTLAKIIAYVSTRN